jgi:hypothetical protein
VCSDICSIGRDNSSSDIVVIAQWLRRFRSKQRFHFLTLQSLITLCSGRGEERQLFHLHGGDTKKCKN